MSNTSKTTPPTDVWAKDTSSDSNDKKALRR